MKFIKIFIVLIVLAVPVIAEESDNIITIGDFDNSHQGFSMRTGELIRIKEDAQNLPLKIDFVFDMPHGIGMNNSELDPWFPGKAVIADLGNIPLEKGGDLIEDDFTFFLEPEEIISGHTYLIRMANGKGYGKIQIIDFNTEDERLTFKWIKLDIQ